MAGANYSDPNASNVNPASAKLEADKKVDTPAVKLPPVPKSIEPEVLHDALKENGLVQYKLGTGKDLTVAANKDGTYTVSLKEGSVMTTSNLSSDGKLIPDKSYSMNGELRTGYQGPDASFAALKDAKGLTPTTSIKNAFQ